MNIESMKITVCKFADDYADDCYIENERLAYVQSVKPIVCTIIELLSNNAVLTRNVRDNFNPEFCNKL